MKEGEKLLWENYHELFEIHKSERQKLVISAAARDGVRCINIREFYLRKRDGVWKPGKDGIVVPIQMPINYGREVLDVAEHFYEAIGKTIDYLTTMPLSDPEHARYFVPTEKSSNHLMTPEKRKELWHKQNEEDAAQYSELEFEV